MLHLTYHELLFARVTLTVTDAAGTDAITRAEAQLREVRRKGIAWLLGHIGEDGEPAAWRSRNGYYRLPWTLAVAGEREAAAQVLSWIERNALGADGDLLQGLPRHPFVSAAATYPLTIIAHGAWVLERYDTALAVMKVLRNSFQDPLTGGAYMERPEARVTGQQLLYPTAQLGLTAMATGQADMAHAVYRWFERLLAAQQQLPERLFTMWGRRGLVTDYTDEGAFLAVTDFRLPRQAFYNPGISAAFLSRYHMFTAEPRPRELAKMMLGLVARGTPEQFKYAESMQICKFGWGSALAAEIDPDGGHIENVVRMARWYYESQGADGSWCPSPFLVPDPSLADAMQKTAEHTLWVITMLSSLAGRNRPPVSRPAGALRT
jgi:hypothetical protein